MLFEAIWLVAMLAAGTWWVRRDVSEYQRFVALDDTQARQRTLRKWIVQSFALLTCASLVTLWLADGLTPFDSFPDAFGAFQAVSKLPERPMSPEMAAGVVVGVIINLAIVGFVQWHRLRKSGSRIPGGTDALIPRNRAEAAHALALSINAGFSEELFFRLALPLLLFKMTGSLLAAFAFAVLCFGLMHAYQGIKGILATAAVGTLITIIYLKTGSLLHVMMLHAAIDVIALFVRPKIQAFFYQLGTRPVDR